MRSCTYRVPSGPSREAVTRYEGSAKTFLRKDGLTTQCIALTLLWNRLIGYGLGIAPSKATFLDMLTWACQWLHMDFSNLPQASPGQVVYLGCALLHVIVLEFAHRPPARYPDIFTPLNVLLSTPVFAFTWLWSIESIIEVRWTASAGGLSIGGEPKERKPT